MAQIVTKLVAKKMLSKEMEKYKGKKVAGDNDPFFAIVKDPRTGREKKVKKQIPDYIPEHDAIILAKMRQRAYWLDTSLFNFLGIRFGWSSVIGLIPAAGDAIDAFLATLLCYRCSKISCGLGSTTAIMMFLNILVDFFVGMVPIIGDIADAAVRANSRNVRLLEKRLDSVYKPKGLKNAQPATVYEDFEDERESLPMHRQDIEPRRPEPARVPTETRGGDKTPGRKGTLKKNNSRRERR